ncbi:MAG TPA: MDR family MFS transporter [Steroidobacteraceae bacterium]|jgi:MFS transporter, DHA2 family, lincomycin resistance protein|nr:MDR family MFS transporter [Steroidobacteraceae bacterium]
MTENSASATSLDSVVAPVVADNAGRNRLVINLLLVATFVVILNETLMAVAIPRLMHDLNVTAGAVQWLTTAFLLTVSVVIPVTGFLLQRLNTRPIFVLAMSLFSLGTLAATLASNLEILILARIIQASGTAIMMPLLMTTVMTLAPPETRGKTMGRISTVISVAPAIGPTISGVILNYLNWRWLFILILPIALGALALGARRIQNVTTPHHAAIDGISVVLSGVAFGGLVYGLSNIGVAAAPGTLPAGIWSAVGAVFLVVFIFRQVSLQKKGYPLLDLRTFESRNFTVSVLLMAGMMMALFGTIILLPIYLQNVLRLSTLQTGLLLLPGGLLMGLLGPHVGRLYDKAGPIRLLVPGVLVVSAVLWAMTLLGSATWVGYILAGHVVMSVGFALLFTPLFTVSLSSLKPNLYSHGSAVIGSIQQVAGAAGVALFVALMSARATTLAAGGLAPVDALTGGIRSGFLCGAVISLFAVACVFFVQKPSGRQELGH